MKEYINYDKLEDKDKEYYLDRVVSMKLQEYIRMYTKMKKAGLTALEIIKLRGLPLSYKDIEEMLVSRRIVIRVIDSENIEIITRK